MQLSSPLPGVVGFDMSSETRECATYHDVHGVVLTVGAIVDVKKRPMGRTKLTRCVITGTDADANLICVPSDSRNAEPIYVTPTNAPRILSVRHERVLLSVWGADFIEKVLTTPLHLQYNAFDDIYRWAGVLLGQNEVFGMEVRPHTVFNGDCAPAALKWSKVVRGAGQFSPSLPLRECRRKQCGTNHFFTEELSPGEGATDATLQEGPDLQDHHVCVIVREVPPSCRNVWQHPDDQPIIAKGAWSSPSSAAPTSLCFSLCRKASPFVDEKPSHRPENTAFNEAFFMSHIICGGEEREDGGNPPLEVCMVTAVCCVVVVAGMVPVEKGVVSVAKRKITYGRRTKEERKRALAERNTAARFIEPPRTRLRAVVSRIERERWRRYDLCGEPRLHRSVSSGTLCLTVTSSPKEVTSCVPCGVAKLIWEEANVVSGVSKGMHEGSGCRPVDSVTAVKVLNPLSSFHVVPFSGEEMRGAFRGEDAPLKRNAQFSLSHLLRVCREYSIHIDARYRSLPTKDALRLILRTSYTKPAANNETLTRGFKLSLQATIGAKQCVNMVLGSTGDLEAAERKFFLWYVISQRALKVSIIFSLFPPKTQLSAFR